MRIDDDTADKRILLEMQRVIPASPAQVFAAWTDPAELIKWWGPKNVRCTVADIDLRIGGHYRIGNELPDKTVVWITGEFEEIQVPHLLVYTWQTNTRNEASEKVTVRFLPHDLGTEIFIRHERIATQTLRDQHVQGWSGCLDGLIEYLTKQISLPRHPS